MFISKWARVRALQAKELELFFSLNYFVGPQKATIYSTLKWFVKNTCEKWMVTLERKFKFSHLISGLGSNSDPQKPLWT